MTLFRAFESQEMADTGIMCPMERAGGMIGGHSTLRFRFDANGYWRRNSWGPGWGYKGNFYQPNEYDAMCADLWTVRMIQEAGQPTAIADPLPTGPSGPT